MTDSDRPWDRPGRSARPPREAVLRTPAELDALTAATQKAIEAADRHPVGSPEHEEATRALLEASHAEMEGFVDSFPADQRRDVALALYRDADNSLRTRFRMLRSAPRSD